MIDTLRFEDYERLDVHPAYGFALTGEKQVTKRFTLTSGYAQIDRFYGYDLVKGLERRGIL